MADLRETVTRAMCFVTCSKEPAECCRDANSCRAFAQSRDAIYGEAADAAIVAVLEGVREPSAIQIDEGWVAGLDDRANKEGWLPGRCYTAMIDALIAGAQHSRRHSMTDSKLREAASAGQASQTNGWRPIETAPKDGAKILATPINEHYVQPGYWPCGPVHFHNGHWYCDRSVRQRPTHWQPLLTPPQPAQEEER